MGFSTYRNPLTQDGSPGAGGWGLSRIDQGVDYLPPAANTPVRAIGNGVITYSNTNESVTGWPSGAFLVYQLSDGDAKGQYIYVAEHLTNLLSVGTRVNAGDTIALAQPGYAWTEWGWAASPGTSPVPAARAPKGQVISQSGLAFARFLLKLGTPVQGDPGSGPWNMGATGAMYTGGASTGGGGGAGPDSSTQGNQGPSDQSGALVYANNLAAALSADPPDPRDNLPFSEQFMAWGISTGAAFPYSYAANPGTGSIATTGPVNPGAISPFGLGGPDPGYSLTNLVRGGIAELYTVQNQVGAGFRPRGNFKCYFMMNPESISVSTSIQTGANAPTPPETNSPQTDNSVYLMDGQTVSFTVIFNRMYEVWKGDKHWDAPGGALPGPSDIGCRWDIRALERLCGLYDAAGYTPVGTTGQGTSGTGRGMAASLPVQVVFGGANSYRFTGRIASLDYSYDLFSKDMIPIQATAQIGIVRIYNPTMTSQDLINSLVQTINGLGTPIRPNVTGGFNQTNITDPQAQNQVLQNQAALIAGNPLLLGALLQNPNLAVKLDKGTTIVGKPGMPQ